MGPTATTTDATTHRAQATAILVMDGICLGSPHPAMCNLAPTGAQKKGISRRHAPKRASGACSTVALVAGSIWKYSASRNLKSPAMMLDGTDRTLRLKSATLAL